MQIRVPVPSWLTRAKDTWLDWANAAVWRGRLFGRECEMRRIDLMITYGFIACISWYAFYGGWKGALAGGLSYVFIMMVALWF